MPCGGALVGRLCLDRPTALCAHMSNGWHRAYPAIGQHLNMCPEYLSAQVATVLSRVNSTCPLQRVFSLASRSAFGLYQRRVLRSANGSECEMNQRQVHVRAAMRMVKVGRTRRRLCDRGRGTIH